MTDYDRSPSNDLLIQLMPQRLEKTRRWTSFILNLLFITAALSAQAEENKEYFYQFPSGHGSMVAFEFNGHIWKQQGDRAAERLTSATNDETRPYFSPDGLQVAYVALLGSTREVFVASSESGETTQLSFGGGFDARVQGWLSETEVLYSTSIRSSKRGALLFSVDINNGQTFKIPLVEAAEGCSFSSDFVYVKNQELIDSNRLYSGGYAQRIYAIDRDLIFLDKAPKYQIPKYQALRARPQSPSKLLTKDYEGTSRNPLCIGERVFFLSDRDGRFNIWSMLSDGSDLEQHTFSSNFDIRSMTTSDVWHIYYQAGGEIYRFELESGKSERVEITMPEFPMVNTERLRFDTAESSEFAVRDDGTLVALVNRGKLWTIEIDTGDATCVECQSGQRVSSIVLSPTGKTVYALHDATGEYQIYSYNLDSGNVNNVDHEIKEPILDFSVSPNGKKMLVRSIPGNLYLLDIQRGITRQIDIVSVRQPNDISWSPNGHLATFVTYVANGLGRVTVYDTTCDSVTYLSSGLIEVASPIFSQDAQEIFYIGNNNFRSSTDDTWAPTNYWPSYDKKSLLYAVDLNTIVDLQNRSQAKSNAKCLRHISDRSKTRADKLLTRELPFVAGNYDSIVISGGRLHAYSKRAERDKWGKIVAFSRDHRGRRSAPRDSFGGITYKYALSPTGRSIVMRTSAGMLISSADTKGDFRQPTLVQSNAVLEMDIDLAKEREQIFNELWRLYRDHFWDPKMNGIDWVREKEKYQTFLSRISNKAELSEVSGFLISGLGAGHTSLALATVDSDDVSDIAQLGAEFDENDGFRVVKIYDGNIEFMEERSPLSVTSPPINLGDQITHIDGVALTSRLVFDQLLYGMVDQPVKLRVKKVDGKVFENEVVPISTSHSAWLRNRAWAAANSALTEKLSGGTVGYIHIQSAFEPDFSYFIKEYSHLHQLRGLILDLRGNNGGNIDPWLLHFLQRRTWLHVADRHSSDSEKYPRGSFDGNLVLLIDGDTYSDGELIAEGVRRLNLGTLIGTRTSGAGKWVNDENLLINGNSIRIPEAAPYALKNGEKDWVIEGRGVEPDIIVHNDPYDFYFGFDAQLKTAVDHAIGKTR